MTPEVRKLQEAEGAFFDEMARSRSLDGRISYQADLRRATRRIGRPGVEPEDPRMFEIQQGAYRDRYLQLVAHRPGGRVLEVGCGPGWLALELGRRGQIVEAYDVSPGAIAVARQMLAENPFTGGFGQVHYHLADPTQADLGVEQYDAVHGWSAFHHLPDFRGFMKRVMRALKPGGIVATMDDYPRRQLEVNVQRFLGLVLPTTERSYADKLRAVGRRLGGRTVDAPEVFSPMEQEKYTTVSDIRDVFSNEFELVLDVPFNAFAMGVMPLLAGPDWWRYPVARAIDALDKLGCRSGIWRANNRMIVSRKAR